MFGAILGDIIGFPYEKSGIKTKDFDLFPIGRARRSTFSDDTILTIAIAHSLMTGLSYAESFHKFGDRFIDEERGWGSSFKNWFKSGSLPLVPSKGNGAAMRVSPIGWWGGDLGQILAEAKKSAEVTHNTESAIMSAQAVAHAIYLAKNGYDKRGMGNLLSHAYPSYNLSRTMEETRDNHVFSALAHESVPEAIISFLQSDSIIDAIRNAVSLGGDSDTQASIAGAIAEAHYGTLSLKREHIVYVLKELPDDFIAVATKFQWLYVN